MIAMRDDHLLFFLVEEEVEGLPKLVPRLDSRTGREPILRRQKWEGQRERKGNRRNEKNSHVATVYCCCCFCKSQVSLHALLRMASWLHG